MDRSKQHSGIASIFATGRPERKRRHITYELGSEIGTGKVPHIRAASGRVYID